MEKTTQSFKQMKAKETNPGRSGFVEAPHTQVPNILDAQKLMHVERGRYPDAQHQKRFEDPRDSGNRQLTVQTGFYDAEAHCKS